MKSRRLNLYEVAALVVIVGGVVLRLFFIMQPWPIFNSDEGTMGIMALHIVYRGEQPIFFYAQNYMGAWQAYLGAALFHLFGATLFSLRLGLLLMIVLFLVSMYFLTRMLYSRGLALVTVALLSLGSSYVIARQLSAIGGYPETLLCSSLAFLLVCWLALSFHPNAPWHYRIGWRCAGYVCWGLVVGWGVWSDLLVLPFVAMSALLLLLCCWRELIHVIPLACAAIGSVLGALPFILYNLHAAPGEDSLSVLAKLDAGGQGHAHAILQGLLAAVQVSVPMMTGNPFCPVTEISFLGPTSPHTWQCTVARDSWSVGYLALLLLALGIALLLSVRYWWRCLRQQEVPSERQERVRQLARLLLLGGALLTFLSYGLSNAPVDWPGIHARYLIGLLVATPAVLWPLWQGAGYIRGHPGWWCRSAGIGCSIVLVGTCVITLVGTGMIFGEIPVAQANYQHDQTLIRQLLGIGAVHIYSDYWTCDRLAFESQEKVICAVVDAHLQPSHNRDDRYYQMVSRDLRAAYVYQRNDLPTGLMRIIARKGSKYRHFTFQGYAVYQPV